MPLSRLSPRSSRSQITTKRSYKRTSGSQPHLQLWAAIRQTRVELEQWQQQIAQVESLFAEHIAPLERKLNRAATNLTEQLIIIFTQNDLSVAERSLLGLWVNENLNSLRNHPFGEVAHIARLSTRWFEVLNNDGPVENQLARLAQKHRLNEAEDQTDFDYAPYDANEEEDEDDDEMLFDFGMHSKKEKQDTTCADKPRSQSDSGPSNEAHDTEGDSQQQKDERVSAATIEETVTNLENKLSIERIFRQLAKVLHPDREQDEAAKATKNALMSECLEARNNKDINTLLTLYYEHVGELPDDLDQNSHMELVKALEMQLKALQQELREKRFGDPLQTMIVERYASTNEAECTRRMKSHASSLDTEIETTEHLVAQLASPEGLTDALEHRRAIEWDRLAIDELTGN